MLTAAEFVERALARLRPVLVPRKMTEAQFVTSERRVKPRAVTAIAALFSSRPWPGWLSESERREFEGRRIRRKTPWPRDAREIPFRLNEQARVLDFHYTIETIGRTELTRTLRLALKKPAIEIGTVRLHAYDPATTRFLAQTPHEVRLDVQRHLAAASAKGHYRQPPLDGVIRTVGRGGATVVGIFGDAEREVPAHQLVLVGAGDDPDSLQRTILHAELFGEDTVEIERMRIRFEDLTGRTPEAGLRHQRGKFFARWATGHHEIHIYGPATAASGQIGILRRNGFTGLGNAYSQKASSRNWTKAIRVVDALADGEPEVARKTSRRAGSVRLPKFGSVEGWLVGLSSVVDKPVALERYLAALRESELVKKADGPELNELGNSLNLLRLRELGDHARQTRDTLAAQVSFAQSRASEIIRGHVGIFEPVRVQGWLFGRQGPYAVIQPPNRADAKAAEPALRRIGFKRRGGGFAQLVGPRDGNTASGAERGAIVLRLAQEVVKPSREDLGELGRRWVIRELERAQEDPRVLGPLARLVLDDEPPPTEQRAASRMSEAASRALRHDLSDAERSFWRAVLEETELPRTGPPHWSMVFLGCGASKATGPRPALELYTGALFKTHREILDVLDVGIDYILSAEHGLLRPDVTVAPYDRTLDDPTRRDAWSDRVASHLEKFILESGRPQRLLVLAGSTYVDGWLKRAEAAGWIVDDPLRGMGLGERRAFAAFLRARPPPSHEEKPAWLSAAMAEFRALRPKASVDSFSAGTLSDSARA